MRSTPSASGTSSTFSAGRHNLPAHDFGLIGHPLMFRAPLPLESPAPDGFRRRRRRRRRPRRSVRARSPVPRTGARSAHVAHDRPRRQARRRLAPLPRSRRRPTRSDGIGVRGRTPCPRRSGVDAPSFRGRGIGYAITGQHPGRMDRVAMLVAATRRYPCTGAWLLDLSRSRSGPAAAGTRVPCRCRRSPVQQEVHDRVTRPFAAGPRLRHRRASGRNRVAGSIPVNVSAARDSRSRAHLRRGRLGERRCRRGAGGSAHARCDLHLVRRRVVRRSRAAMPWPRAILGLIDVEQLLWMEEA